MTLTLDFQGQILKQRYLRNKDQLTLNKRGHSCIYYSTRADLHSHQILLYMVVLSHPNTCLGPGRLVYGAMVMYFLFKTMTPIPRRPLHWTKYSWYSENWQSSVLKPPVPNEFLICKGSSHVAASRQFVDYAVNNKSALALRDWMKDIRAPDEHYFQSLNHNPHKGVPGAFSGTVSSRLSACNKRTTSVIQIVHVHRMILHSQLQHVVKSKHCLQVVLAHR